MPLIYTPPTEAEAREWALDHPGAPASSFACQYPGRYREAAALARQAQQALVPGKNNAKEC